MNIIYRIRLLSRDIHWELLGLQRYQNEIPDAIQTRLSIRPLVTKENFKTKLKFYAILAKISAH